MLDIADDPSIGPNAVRHFDQSMQAVASLPGTLTDKLDVITAVDEYVFGFCIHERSDFHDDETDEHILDYVRELIASGDYPQLADMVKDGGLESLWAQLQDHARDESRFERNLNRLLDGIERSLPS